MYEIVVGVFFGVVLTALVIAMLYDWNGDEPGRQSFKNRKR